MSQWRGSFYDNIKSGYECVRWGKIDISNGILMDQNALSLNLKSESKACDTYYTMMILYDYFTMSQ